MGKKMKKIKSAVNPKKQEKNKNTKNNKENKDKKTEKNFEKDKETLINSLKYLSVYIGNKSDDEGVKCFNENGEEMYNLDCDIPLHYCDFGFMVDVDDGKIFDWKEKNIYAKVNIRVIDTGFYTFLDKNKNKIYEKEGYVPDFLGISALAYDNICFDTDVNGYILNWKENNIKEKIIEYLWEYME